MNTTKCRNAGKAKSNVREEVPHDTYTYTHMYI